MCDFAVLTSEGRSAYFLTLLQRSSRHFMNKSGLVSMKMRHQVERKVCLGDMTIQLHVLEKNMSLVSTVSYLPHLLSYETINLHANLNNDNISAKQLI